MLGFLQPQRTGRERQDQASGAFRIAWNLFLFLFLIFLDRWQIIHKGFLFPPLLPSILALKLLASLAVALAVYFAARRRRPSRQRVQARPKPPPSGTGEPAGFFLSLALLFLLGLLTVAGRHVSSSATSGRRSASHPAASEGEKGLPGGNIILIIIDTLRADHLGCYGYERPLTPNIDSLAGDGILFKNCISQAPWTIPSIMSIMTSMYPSVNGVQDVKSRINPMRTTLAELLQASCYRTGVIFRPPIGDRRVCFSYGLDRFEDRDQTG